MVKYVDDGVLCGWYYQTREGFYYGDGSIEMARKIEREREEELC